MQLQLGDVFLLHCGTCQTPKPKFFVVVALNPVRCFLINSRLTAFQQANPALLAAQALITAAENQFLAYDSYIGCNSLFGEYSELEIQGEVAVNPGVYKGRIGPLAAKAIGAALVNSHQLPRRSIPGLQADWPP